MDAVTSLPAFRLCRRCLVPITMRPCMVLTRLCLNHTSCHMSSKLLPKALSPVFFLPRPLFKLLFRVLYYFFFFPCIFFFSLCFASLCCLLLAYFIRYCIPALNPFTVETFLVRFVLVSLYPSSPNIIL